MKLETWLSGLLASADVFVPQADNEAVHWQRYRSGMAGDGKALLAALGRIRPSEPVKSFLFNPRQTVAGMPDRPEPSDRRQVLFGMKNCDSAALRVHEKILGQGEFADPFFGSRLRNTVRVVADCPSPKPSCFCNLAGLLPYAGEGADVLLGPLEGRVVVETLSEAGESIVEDHSALFRPATDSELAQRDAGRKRAAEQLSAANPKPWGKDLARAIAARMPDTAYWQRHAEQCVECYGCLLGCPTCYCFLLYDQAREKGFERTRVWDACYEAAYTRVGGGANDRGRFLKRFANRFECKWKEFPNDHGVFACSGCGRCLNACMGGIDIRKVLAEL